MITSEITSIRGREEAHHLPLRYVCESLLDCMNTLFSEETTMDILSVKHVNHASNMIVPLPRCLGEQATLLCVVLNVYSV